MNRITRNMAAILAVSAAAMAAPVLAQSKLESDKDKVSYMIGMDVARSLTPYRDEVNPTIVAEALSDILSGRTPRMTDEEAEGIRQAFIARIQSKQQAEAAEASSKNLAEGQAFLRDNRSKPGVVTTATGLQYKVIKEGSGARPTAENTVKVHYHGTLLNGTVFDSSVQRGQPAEFPLNRVIKGWTEGVQLMTVGSKYTFWVPSELAYGEQGTPPPGPIGPNTTLVFEVELLDIVR
ncbi:MAG TPA: hypothetical protein DDZ76_04065 [Xanthomonadales bacterium]|nr:hypothetical protein [Xanthomonadales bacterium]